MTEPRPSRSQCPRCTAPLNLGAERCGRCGIDLETTSDGQRMQPIGAICPRCDRVAEPGSRFVGTVGVSEHGTCGSCGTPLVAPERVGGVAYEEKAVACPPYELERMAKAEAVDGWTLLDTTVDPAAPENIVAYFRRGVRAEERAEPGAASAPRRRSAGRERRRKPAGPPSSRPAARPRPADGAARRRKRGRSATAAGTAARVERVRRLRRAEAGRPAARPSTGPAKPSGEPGTASAGSLDPALEQVRRTVAQVEADARRARQRAKDVRRQAKRAAKRARHDAKMARREAKALRKRVSARRSGRAAGRANVRVRSVPADRVAVQAAEALGWAVAAALQLALLLTVVALRQVVVPTLIFAFWLCRTVMANLCYGVPMGRRHRSRRYVSP